MSTTTTRKVSRRQSLSRRRSKSRNGGGKGPGGKGPGGKGRYSRDSRYANTRYQQQQRHARAQNEIQIDRYHKNLAITLLRDSPEIVKELFELGPNEGIDANFMQNLYPTIGRNFNVKILTVALLVVMAEQADAGLGLYKLGRGNRRKISTKALQNAWAERDPRRPGEIWSFFQQFNFDGRGGWSFESIGPRPDPTVNYDARAEKYREEARRREQDMSGPTSYADENL